ncbi:MAG TPA: hypothetical protein VL614_24345 [Acetobacteraceae bacterium]|jgi:hypothetical protein|nr:hypothetical protein [Acetobacteraceae bacterium]
MIRPITCICFLLACGSGLYLYQAKHRVQLLDRKIEDTVQATDKLREQTRVLHAEWTLLNDPQRLQTLAEQFLALKTVQPNQFTSMADLDSRLPAVPPPAPPPQAPAETALPPIAQDQPQPDQAATPKVAELPKPPQALPEQRSTPAASPEQAPKPVAVAAAPPSVAKLPEPKPVEHKPPPPPRPVLAEVRPESHAIARPVIAAAAARTVVPQSTPYTGSALGMARSAAPLPAPTPVSATQWVGNGNGGG